MVNWWGMRKIKGDLFLLELKICIVVLYSDQPSSLFSCHMKTVLRKLGRTQHSETSRVPKTNSICFNCRKLLDIY